MASGVGVPVGSGLGATVGAAVGVAVERWFRTLTLIRWLARICTGGEKDVEPRLGFVAAPRKAAAVIVCGPSLISVEFHGIVYGGPEAR